MGQKIVAAVDIGSSKICTLLANVDGEGAVQVLGTGICPSRGIHKGLVTDIDQASDSIGESVAMAEQTSGEHISSVYVGVTGNNVSSRSNRSIVAMGRNARPVAPDDINRALTSSRQFDVPEERKLLHVIPTHYTLDGQIGVKDPIGMHGFRLDVDTHVVSIAQGSAENIMKSVRKAGLKIESLILDCLASAQSVLHLDETDTGVVLADIGAGTTGIAAYKNGSVMLTAVLPVGGNQITRDLSIGLGVPSTIAEQLKQEHCDLTKRDDNEETDEHAATINLNGVGKIAKRDLNEIAKARVDEIMKLVISQLPNYQTCKSDFPAGLVLTGGTSNMRGIEGVAQAITGLTTRAGIPQHISGVADTLHGPAYASSIGVLLCSGRWKQEQSWINEGLWSKLAGSFKNMRQHVPRIKVYSGI
ncbi:cell division protein FtsA [Chloroflexota bacterium]